MTISLNALYSHLIEDLSEVIPINKEEYRNCFAPPNLPGNITEQSPSDFACYALLRSFAKKFAETSSNLADTNAVIKFLHMNDMCQTWERTRRPCLFIDELVGYFKDEVHRFLNPKNREPLVSTSEEILHLSRMGPGASVGASGNDFYTKLFSSDLTATSRFFEVAYTNYYKHSTTWGDAEKFRQSLGLGVKVVSGNRLSVVPKNVDISRTICTEPSLNMYFQLGLGEIITRRLRKVYKIDLSTQPMVNRELARRGSLGKDLCTIDLESASDSISLKMIEAYFPKDFVLWLKTLRSPTTILPDGECKELSMVSTMGNGFTFPLQTAIFSCAVSAVYRFLGIPREKAGKTWSVFGDDIVVPSKVLVPFVQLVEHLGFLVNRQKSFFEGPFRESCGCDFYEGHNVRGVYIKRLRTQQDRYVAINLLNRWSARTGVMLPRTVQALLKTVRYLPIPPADNDDAGVKVPLSMVTRLKRNKHMQSIMYRRYVSEPQQITVAEGRLKHPKGAKKRFYNPNGLLVAFLGGYVENGKISIRHNANTYRLRTGVTPFWDWHPAVSGSKKLNPTWNGLEWQVAESEAWTLSWESSVRLNHSV